jgi:signal transduction histidine kinase
MTARHWKYVVQALVVIMIFAFLSLQSQRVNDEAHNQYRSDLRELEGLHATLNENVLQARLGLLTYFDPLNATLDEIDRVRLRLGQIPAYVSAQVSSEINAALQGYDQLLNENREFVERFKTHNAVLANSLSYFTIVVSDLTNQTVAVPSASAVRRTLDNLLRDVLLYDLTVDETLVFEIEGEIEQLLANRGAFATAVSGSDVNLDVLVSHTNIVLERKPISDDLINDMLSLPLPNQILQLSSLYDNAYNAARLEANLYQVALYIFSLAVVGYIAITIISRLNTSAAVLRNAKEELQVTYSDLENRTHELESANVDLQKATHEAREASRLKDEFLAVMSHELRTPLNAIIGFQGILLMKEQLTERATHMLERAQSNAERLLALISDILDISRIESGRLQLTPVDVQIADVVESWRAQMSVLAEEKGLDFSVHVDSSMPATIWADEDALTKIVTNLLGNAFKFTQEGGVTLDLKRSNGHCIIEVSDTGIGIPTHMYEIIFERFRQVDSSSTRRYGGSGLGLAIVNNLCKAMNGTVTVQSEPDKGSTFTVTLPIETSLEGGNGFGV